MAEGRRILRTSERRDLLSCPQKWWYAWRMGLRKRGPAADALWFGTGVHVALAAWYCGPGEKRGPEPAETWQQWAKDEVRAIKVETPVGDEQEAKYIDAIQLGVTMLEGYRQRYGYDEHMLIIQPEKTFSFSVPWPADQTIYEHMPQEEMFLYCGTYDGVWRHADTGQIWLEEHKTAAAITLDHLSLDPQAGSYWAMAGRTLRDEGLISPKEDLAGIEYNFLRKGVPDKRPKDAQGYATNLPKRADYIAALELCEPSDPVNNMKLSELVQHAQQRKIAVLGARSKSQPPPLFVRQEVHRTRPERRKQLVRLQQEGMLIEAYRSGMLPVLRAPGRDCPRCQYFELCELDEAGGDTKPYMDAAFARSDPYTDHR